MTFDQDNLDDSTSNVRKQRRQQEDKKRMAYRRAIEDYRESKALHALVCDFPDLIGTAQNHQRLH
ncbi:transcriptional regulator [Halopseudomonas laoshanensis]|jgi:hypothetical protein|uniref:Transcriptional regulator n=1 Tax=Halopseudomonas laoshanensis TaxID=2268758 RepID=A0A7V7GSX7_9GAMM|nr:transcriptional regulator [Halopseudomonas laoshanensis]KAA0694014.1 transcriptional regulator [Halopseudomonas laoshanensis]MBQ0744604.1 transcriptional regulator [Pseudomonas sp.]MBQ0778237.1 transcriptional regulator [Pseudomonas sp.]